MCVCVCVHVCSHNVYTCVYVCLGAGGCQYMVSVKKQENLPTLSSLFFCRKLARNTAHHPSSKVSTIPSSSALSKLVLPAKPVQREPDHAN